jgi:hypothetical protein
MLFQSNEQETEVNLITAMQILFVIKFVSLVEKMVCMVWQYNGESSVM